MNPGQIAERPRKKWGGRRDSNPPDVTPQKSLSPNGGANMPTAKLNIRNMDAFAPPKDIGRAQKLAPGEFGGLAPLENVSQNVLREPGDAQQLSRCCQSNRNLSPINAAIACLLSDQAMARGDVLEYRNGLPDLQG